MFEQAVPEEITNWVKQSKRLTSIERIPGDASTRRYYRVGADNQTFILMCVDPFADKGWDLDFLAVQKHLAACQVAVPKVIDVDAARGYVLLEDLGDDTLLHRLKSILDTDLERAYYQRAIDILVQMQTAASQPGKGKRIETFDLFFDFKKLMWEVDFTIEHFYEKHLARKFKPGDVEIIREGFGKICTILAAEPTVFTHRDYHSRNIMVTGAPGTPEERYVMIDFQDARLGPIQYDLASLLRDSYYQLEESQVRTLLDYTIAKLEAATGKMIDRKHFLYIFDLMAIQRNFKAIGSFASFLNRRGNATYLKYIGNTFENIRRTLVKYPEYARLREVLIHYYYF